jgi:hypothetical protein
MDAPKCLVCGNRHWSRQLCSAMGKDERLQHARDVLRQAKAVTKPETKIPVSTETKPPVTVTKPPPVTKPPAETKARIGRPPVGDKPMTNTERVRRHRARRKAAGSPRTA